MNILGVIPARYASTRFPGKPLIDLGGKTMIQRVYEKAKEVIEHVFVATDSRLIFSKVKEFGGMVVMTSDTHPSGTDRIAEAYQKISSETGYEWDVIINIQGDEPFLHTEQLNALISCFEDPDTDIGTLVKKTSDPHEIFNPNIPKVIVNEHGFAQYFSRSTIPYIRESVQENWPDQFDFLRHIGLYGYRRPVLLEITTLKQSSLEMAEKLEQLRWLQNGFKIKVALTDKESYGIDTPEDVEILRQKGLIQ